MQIDEKQMMSPIFYKNRWHFICSIPVEWQLLKQEQQFSNYHPLPEDTWNPCTRWDKHSGVGLTPISYK